MLQLDESAVPARVYVEKRDKQRAEIARRSIDTLVSPSSPLKNVESSAFSVFLSSNSWGDRLVVSAVG